MSSDSIEKKRRFDRQLRIWGEQGQSRLERTAVLSLGASAAAAETLKNLVLAGVSAFTIVDGGRVEARDLQSNFFVDASWKGRPKAAALAALLSELGLSVDGNFVEEDVIELCARCGGDGCTLERLLDSAISKGSPFTMVIAAQLPRPCLSRLDTLCRRRGLPLVSIHSLGLIGTVRASLAEHCVIDSRPEAGLADLRLHDPWTELRDWALSLDVAAFDNATASHLPWAALLVRSLAKFSPSLRPPASKEEQRAFKAIVKSSLEREFAGGSGVPENLKEALANAYRVWSPPVELPPEVECIFEQAKYRIDSCCECELKRSESASGLAPGHDAHLADNEDKRIGPLFWIVAAAISRFYNSEGRLPLEGSVPDMTSSTDTFLLLQTLYYTKSQEDTKLVRKHAREILMSVVSCSHVDQIKRSRLEDINGGTSSRDCEVRTTSSDQLDEMVTLACKNARNLRVVRWDPIGHDQEIPRLLVLINPTESNAEDKDQEAAAFHGGLLLADRFLQSFGYYPGSVTDGKSADSFEDDLDVLRSENASMLKSVVGDEILQEICRYGDSELHSTASILGGIAAQEIIKILTGQFLPADGTILYNGINATVTILSRV